jgi:hypothetical protein
MRLGIALLVLVGALGTAATAFAQRPAPTPGSTRGWKSWPVAPVFSQHPIRGGFLDPRPAAVYHTGVDISVRDDRPEPGHPANRTHRVYAIESGTVWMPEDEEKRSCQGRLLHVGHFGYSHVDPIGTVEPGQHVQVGEMLGWTCYHHWHMHLSEFATQGGRQVYVNPLRAGGRLAPYVDTAPPVIQAVRFFSPTEAAWRTVRGALFSQPDGELLQPLQLRGQVDIRALAGDPQSYSGWMTGRLALLRTSISPYELHVSLRRHLGTTVWNRVVFKANQLPTDPFNRRYAAGTAQNLPVYDCRTGQPIQCAGSYWYHAGPRSGSAYWDTTTDVDGSYDLCVTALDIEGNKARRCVAVAVANNVPVRD